VGFTLLCTDIPVQVTLGLAIAVFTLLSAYTSPIISSFYHAILTAEVTSFRLRYVWITVNNKSGEIWEETITVQEPG
jgi:hypothetical protein